MSSGSEHAAELLPHLFREEYGKLTSVLCHLFGLQHMEVAEDIASDTFLKATEAWSVHGLPEKPVAWLYAVAKNKTLDYLRRNRVLETEVKKNIACLASLEEELQEEFTDRNIGDSQLEMIFAVCDPVNSEESQICLALQVLCGFSINEIAAAFLTGKETIRKRLVRARSNLRGSNFRLRQLSEKEVHQRLDTVLATLYLLFNEGYCSRSGVQFIRRELCAEAMRLVLVLAENELTVKPKVNALLALMCFQSSRLASRINEQSDIILFEQQNRELWDKDLINRGNYYLIMACREGAISRYHLEASIAYWHAVGSEDEKWTYILLLYNQLLLQEYTPVSALNRTFALAKVHGREAALQEAQQLALDGHLHYHSLLGYLYSDSDRALAAFHFRKAITLTSAPLEIKVLEAHLARLG